MVIAAVFEAIDIVKILLEKDADVNVKSVKKKSELSDAFNALFDIIQDNIDFDKLLSDLAVQSRKWATNILKSIPSKLM